MTKTPFPGYFQPIVGYPQPDGSAVWSPDPAELTAEAIGRWRRHLQMCVHPVLRARYADLLWEFQNKVEGTKPPLQLAHTAIEAYLAAAKLPKAESGDATNWLSRAVDLAPQ